MPSRLGVGLILAFWFLTAAYVIHRDVWPRYFSDSPPAVLIELADEATQTTPARWTLYRGDTKLGTLRTSLNYTAADDTFTFTSGYRDLVYTADNLRCKSPDLVTTITVGRGGELRAQTMKGKLVGEFLAGPVVLFKADADASLSARVVGGQLVGRVTVDSPLGKLDEELSPVPVPAGQVLNPLQPVNRLSALRPGQRWVVYEVNPLAVSLTAMATKLLKQKTGSALANFAPAEKGPLVASVSAEPVRLKPDGPECWVIEYRREAVEARTWVRVDDGKVVRQETVGEGPPLRLERED